MKKLLLLACFFSLSANAEIPRYDVEGYCKSVKEVSGGSDMIYNGCIDMEQEAYNSLKPNWERYTEKTKKYCNDVGKVSGGSYTILEGCIDMELEESNNKSKFEF